MAQKPVKTVNISELERNVQRSILVYISGKLHHIHITVTAKVVPVAVADVSSDDLLSLPTPDRVMKTTNTTKLDI